MTRLVLLTDAAARDLDELYADAYGRDGSDGATRILDRIEVAFEWLAERAERGKPIGALRRLGMREALQLHLEALRLIYRLSDDEVHVVAVAPHARSMQSLLQRRMLEA